MANRTAKEAKTIHGTNPQFLIEKIIRTRIYESRYWKEDCFGLSAELLVDRGVDLKYIGGTYGGNIKPSPFLCLILKMLQIQPEKDIIHEFIRQEDFKYCRALGAFYLRLTGQSAEIYKYLEPLLNDYRKLRQMDRMGQFTTITMDDFIDDLLRDDRKYDVILPRMQKRFVHEENGELDKRISALDADLELEDDEDEGEDKEEGEIAPPKEEKDSRRHDDRKADKYRDRDRRRSRSRSVERSRRRRSSRSPSPHARYDDRHHYRPSRRSRSRSPDRQSRYGRSRKSRSRDRDPEPERKSHRRDRSNSRERRREKQKEKIPEKNLNRNEATRSKDEAGALSLSIAETNKIRAQLGLKPLKV